MAPGELRVLDVQRGAEADKESLEDVRFARILV
jgi:hypothetical protein